MAGFGFDLHAFDLVFAANPRRRICGGVPTSCPNSAGDYAGLPAESPASRRDERYSDTGERERAPYGVVLDVKMDLFVDLHQV